MLSFFSRTDIWNTLHGTHVFHVAVLLLEEFPVHGRAWRIMSKGLKAQQV